MTIYNRRMLKRLKKALQNVEKDSRMTMSTNFNERCKKMDFEIFDEERNLSACETTIMKAIWDTGEDISVPALIELLREYGKDYARTTVVTFLLKLSDKGFVRTYRRGRLSYVRAMKSEVEYRQKLLEEEVDFWFKGDATNLISALCSTGKLPKDKAERIKDILNDLDD